MSLKAILNTVIYDPLVPIPSIQDMSDTEFMSKFKVGRGIEIFDWFSLVMLRNQSIKKQKDLLSQIKLDQVPKPDFTNWNIDMNFKSLLERVLVNDYFNYVESKESEYNRIESFKNMQIMLENHELLQKDMSFNTPIDYFLHFYEVRDKKKQENKMKETNNNIN